MNTLSLAEAREWCQGQLKFKKFDFVWTVENFSSIAAGVGQISKSPEFSADPNDEEQPKWYLKLYPGGEEEETKDFVSIDLFLRKSKTPIVRATFKIAILNTKGGNTHEKADGKIDKFEQKVGWGWSDFIRRDTLLEQKEELLPEDRLTIFVEIGMVVETVTAEIPIPQYRLSEDMGAMLEGNLLTDCVICASDNEQFQAHKSVLACRSPVFAAMFGYDTAEARDAVVRIEDIGGPALGQLLKFVYTGQAPPLLAERGMAAELLAAADKYHLDRLKALCERQLCRGMDKENVCTVLALADLHNAHTLRQHAIEYLCCEVEDA